MTIKVESSDANPQTDQTPEPAEGTVERETESEQEEESSEAKESEESGTEEQESEQKDEKESSDQIDSEDDSDESEDDDSDDDDESEDSKSEEEKEKPKRRKNGFQKRIKKLNSRIAERDREIEYLKKLAFQERDQERPSSETTEEKPSEPTGKPNPDDFETQAEYVDALTDWKLEQREKQTEAERRAQAMQTKQAEMARTYTERAEAFAAEHEDFHDVLEEVEDIPVSPAVQGLILESENGPQIAYQLAQDRETFERINQLPPLAAAREVGRIEARLSAASPEKPKAKKSITKAPRPIEPVGGRSKGATKKDIFDPNLPFSEYERLRREQIKKARGA